VSVIKPYVIDLGMELYMDLFDDPDRPENNTVEQYAKDTLCRVLKAKATFRLELQESKEE
jgi:hypothetical protein